MFETLRDFDDGWAFGIYALLVLLTFSVGVITDEIWEAFHCVLTLTSVAGSANVGATCCAAHVLPYFFVCPTSPCADHLLKGIISEYTKSVNAVMPERSRNIDGGWAWVILACAFSSYALNGALSYSVGIITEAMLEVFHGDLTLTSVVGSAIIGAQCCAGPLAAVVNNQIGSRSCAILGGIIAMIGFTGMSLSRHLLTVLVFGIVTGLGYSLPLMSGGFMVGLYFQRLLPLAAGIAITGAGFGVFLGPLLIRYLIDQYGLHGAFLIMAGVSFHFCLIGSPLRPQPEHKDRQKRLKFGSLCVTLCKKLSKCDICHFRKWQCVGFMIYMCSVFFWCVAESACLIHLPNYCIQQGTSKTDTALLFTAMGVANILSRLLTGFAASDEGVNTITLHAGQLGVVSIFTGLFPLYSRTYAGQMAYSTALGIYTCGASSLYSPLIVQLIGLDNLALGYGLILLCIGGGYLTGSPVAGAIVDYGATYRESYMFAGFVYLLASVSAMLIPLVHSKANDKDIPLEEIAEDTNFEIDQTEISDGQLKEKMLSSNSKL